MALRNVIKTAIEASLTTALNPTHLEVINVSHMHSVPRNSETHFKAVIISDSFDGMRLI